MKRVVGTALFAGMLVVMSLLVACGGDENGGSANTAEPGGATVAAGTTATTTDSGNPTAPAATQQQSPSAPTAEPQSSGNTPDVRAPLQAGSSAEVHADDPDPNVVANRIADLGRVRVTIVAIHDDLDVGDSIFQPEEGNRFWALEVTMEALDDTRVNSGFWMLRTTDGSEYDWSYVPGLDKPSLNYNAIEPGETMEGFLVFEIPEGATVESVKMDPHIFVGGNLIFE